MLVFRAFHKLLETSKKVPPNFSISCPKKVINFHKLLRKYCRDSVFVHLARVYVF